MFKYKFYVTAEDIDAHVKNNLNEDIRELLKDAKFVPFEINLGEDRNIEITAVAVVDAVANDENRYHADLRIKE
jgi:hypothetical protein